MSKECNGQKQSNIDRRLFLKGAMAGGLVALAGGIAGPFRIVAWAQGGQGAKAILADLSKCTGCRLCEMFCSSYNAAADGLPATLGNPTYARIKVANFNPDIDVPVVCAMCPKPPCVDACPVTPDPATGRKAIFRDQATGTIKADASRCTTCGSCEAACVTGVISLDMGLKQPVGMCSLCGGDPQCVKRCPAEALSLVPVDVNREFYGQRADAVFKTMAQRWYGGI
ncbi:4Fe-4S dicluster domain-containing protein [Fundidesulfovibrio soli]|uniref:4Fe-4S dicluster domain-containing protein n=1 Tax=Fundidesulfovibrio soli TaxID=2922716 RepID=UPI001FAF46D9|nr:4Fe-4S dicluster domain-containing protein [Fundidesulfovibrio soli]